MENDRLERLYEERNLKDYKLKTLDDLFYIHGVRLSQIKGYNSLSEEEKRAFRVFIISLYNAHGVKYRDIVPLKVYIALEKEYVINTYEVKDFVIRRTVINDRTKEVEELWHYDRFRGERGKLKSMERYMRFEYIENGRNVWVHINRFGGWY